MKNWLKLGDDTLLNLDKVWHVSHIGGARNELRFLVELNFPDPHTVKEGEIWHEVRENFKTREDMMIAFDLIAQHIGALSLDKAVEKLYLQGVFSKKKSDGKK